MSESQTTSSRYRVIRFEPEHDNRVLLHDIETSASVSVRTKGYDTQMDSKLVDLVSGNAVEATVTGNLEDRNSWEFESLEVLSDQTLFLQHDINSRELSAPVQTVWEERNDEGVAWDTLTDPETDQLLAELQVHSEELPDVNIWRSMLEAHFDFEPWYNGEYLFSGSQPIHDIVVVNPSDTEFLVFFSFPEGSSALEDVREEVEKQPAEA